MAIMDTLDSPLATPTGRVRQAYQRISQTDRPEIWIQLRDEDDTLAEARDIEERVAAGEQLALAGSVLAVKDNIDVAGLATTAACPAYAYLPTEDAPAVARLRAAGAVVIGKTNMDQFATGLTGTRSPHGAVRDARRPEYVSGGSSSGSAVAVALGLTDLGLATDTAGSGRVPAAFQGIVGLKPTIGLIPTRGVVPACRSLDCVSVFARTVAAADQALWIMAGIDPDAENSAQRGRPWLASAPLSPPPRPRVAVPATARLASLIGRGAVAAFNAMVASLTAEIVEVDITPLLDAADLLYGGAFVAERAAAFGEFADGHAEQVDPSVLAIVRGAARASASALVKDQARLDKLRVVAGSLFEMADALLMPTVPFQPTLAEAAANSIAINRALGVFTNFVNLLDLSAVAVPAGVTDGLNFGVTLMAPAFHDRVVADIAATLAGEPRLTGGPVGVELFVIGAHRNRQPLNHELVAIGARYLTTTRTAGCYRLYALETDPPKPGLARVAAGGAAIEGELWMLPKAALGPFLEALPRPMALGHVELEDGRQVVGFTCEPIGLQGASDITVHGSWIRYLDARHGERRSTRGHCNLPGEAPHAAGR